MKYPELPNYDQHAETILRLVQLKAEHRAAGIEPILKDAEAAMLSAIKRLEALPPDAAQAEQEPDGLTEIKALRSAGPRRVANATDNADYPGRLEGALLGRMAANILGSPVELWDIPKMEALAEELGAPFPPTDYWTYVPEPARLRYQKSRRDEYIRGKLRAVPVDDDIAYTLLGLLIMEEFGPELSVEKVGQAWLKYLPYAATAEHIALENLKAGTLAAEAATKDNLYLEWIGADIRSDPWGYMSPGWPEKAAEFAYHDAYYYVGQLEERCEQLG